MRGARNVALPAGLDAGASVFIEASLELFKTGRPTPPPSARSGVNRTAGLANFKEIKRPSRSDGIDGTDLTEDGRSHAPISTTMPARRCCPRRATAMLAALDVAANPSSVHAEGRAARRLIEEARRAVAALVGAKPEHVVFTSGATEAASTLLTPDWQMGRGAVRMRRLYVVGGRPSVPAVRRAFSGDAVETLPRRRATASLDLAALRRALDRHDRRDGLPLVAIHAANNETGVIQPVAGSPRSSRRRGGILVVDAVQAAGRIPLDMSAGYADYLILSSHKIGGPKGVGAIVAAADLMMPKPLIAAAARRRAIAPAPKTSPAIAGFGAAAREALRRPGGRSTRCGACATGSKRIIVRRWRPTRKSSAPARRRLANTTFFAIPGIKAETAQIAFDLAGVALSAGSACSSGKVGPSHVLKAMGYGDSLAPCACRSATRPAPRTSSCSDRAGGNRSRAAAAGQRPPERGWQRFEALRPGRAVRCSWPGEFPAQTHYMELTPLDAQAPAVP